MQTTRDRGTPETAVRDRPVRRGRQWPATAALAAALLAGIFVATGCSSGSTTSGAGAGGTADGGTLARQLLLRGDQDLVSFTRCMRAHGAQMSDPYHQPGHTGLTVNFPPHDAVTHAAYASCNHYITDLIQVKESRTIALASSQLAALTRYAECMRGHDITMLDPNAQGELNLGNVPGMADNDFGRTSPQFRSADAACRRLLPAGVTDDGTGP